MTILAKGAQELFTKIKDGFVSTKAGADLFNTTTAQVTAGFTTLFRQLTIGHFTTYNTSISESIRLTGEFQTALNNFTTDKIKVRFQTLAIDL
jgi:hypothetical protein